MMNRVVQSKGCPLTYRVEGQGLALVFIQGVGIHSSGCDPQVDDLKRDFTCLTWDNRGIGNSQPMGAPLSVEQMTEDVLTVMDAAGVDRAHVVGHSLGGMIAQQVALTAQHRVKTLTLMCTSARGKDATRFAPDLIWLGIRSNVGTVHSKRMAFLRIVMPDGYLAGVDRGAEAERIGRIIGHDLGRPAPVTMKQLGVLNTFDSRARLAELAGIPTLVVAAAEDRIFPPRFLKALAAGIPGSRYAELEGGHGVTIQRPAETNALLREHCSGTAG